VSEARAAYAALDPQFGLARNERPLTNPPPVLAGASSDRERGLTEPVSERIKAAELTLMRAFASELLSQADRREDDLRRLWEASVQNAQERDEARARLAALEDRT
jgi:hypothetical protein